MVCKIDGCNCQKQEIPTHLLYWLTHHNIDIRPLFQKPYLGRKKKPTTVVSSDHEAVTNAAYHFVPVENGENVLEEFLWNTMPNLDAEKKNVPPVSQPNSSSSDVKRSVPYKVPSSNNGRRRV